MLGKRAGAPHKGRTWQNVDRKAEMILKAASAVKQTLIPIVRDGTPSAFYDRMPRFAEFNEFIGLPTIRDLEKEFRVTEGG